MRQANDYYQASVMLMGVSSAVDPVISEAESQIEDLRDVCNSAIVQIKDKVTKRRMFESTHLLPGELFFTKGSEVYTHNFWKARKAAESVSYKTARRIIPRSHGYHSKVTKLINRLTSWSYSNADIFGTDNI